MTGFVLYLVVAGVFLVTACLGEAGALPEVGVEGAGLAATEAALVAEAADKVLRVDR